MDAKRTHAMDQGTAGLADFAALLGAYRRELIEHGFSREEAFALVLAYQTTALSALRPGPE